MSKNLQKEKFRPLLDKFLQIAAGTERGTITAAERASFQKYLQKAKELNSQGNAPKQPCNGSEEDAAGAWLLHVIHKVQIECSFPDVGSIILKLEIWIGKPQKDEAMEAVFIEMHDANLMLPE